MSTAFCNCRVHHVPRINLSFLGVLPDPRSLCLFHTAAHSGKVTTTTTVKGVSLRVARLSHEILVDGTIEGGNVDVPDFFA